MSRLPFVLALCLCGAGALLSAGPQSWRVATQAHFLKGDLEQLAVDEHGRVTPRPGHHYVYDTGVPFVWTAASDAAGTTYRHRERRQGVQGRRGRAAGRSSTTRRNRVSTPWPRRQAAGSSSPPRRMDASLQGRRRGHGGAVLRSRRAIHLGVARRCVSGRCSWPPAIRGAACIACRPPAPGSRSTPAAPPTSPRSRPMPSAASSSGRSRRAACSGSTPTAGRSCCSTRRCRRCGRFAATRAAACSSSPRPHAPVATAAAMWSRPPHPSRARAGRPTSPCRSRRCPSSTPARPRRRARPPRPRGRWPAPSSASTPTARRNGLEMRDDTPYDVAPQDDGALLVATGHRGKLFRLDGDPWRATLLGRVGGREALQFLPAANGRTLIATAKAARWCASTPATPAAARGRRMSAMRRAWLVGGRCRGGRPRRPAPASMCRRAPATRRRPTRHGRPGVRDGDSEGSPSGSPTARYLQWRVTLSGTGESPVLTAVAAAYLQKNQRPVVSGIVVHPPGRRVPETVLDRGKPRLRVTAPRPPRSACRTRGQPPVSTAAPTLGRRTFQQGLQTVVWKGDDANGDDLVYDVAWAARRRGDVDAAGQWPDRCDLRVGHGVGAELGRYLLRITASDAPTQPADQALRGDAESPSVDVDTVAPVVTLRPAAGTGGRLAMTVEVRDQQSTGTGHGRIRRRWRGAWQAAYPADGMLDSRAETLTITFPNEARGKTLVVRARRTRRTTSASVTP